MYNQLEKLRGAAVKLEEAKSLLNFSGDYFNSNEPNALTLLSRYNMNSDMQSVINKIMYDQLKVINEAYNGLGSIRKLKGGAVQ